MLKHFSISVEAGVVSICLSDRKRADDVNTNSDRQLKTVDMRKCACMWSTGFTYWNFYDNPKTAWDVIRGRI